MTSNEIAILRRISVEMARIFAEPDVNFFDTPRRVRQQRERRDGPEVSLIIGGSGNRTMRRAVLALVDRGMAVIEGRHVRLTKHGADVAKNLVGAK